MATNVTAPNGSHWEYEEVKTKGKTESLGDRPLLVWDDLDAARSYYGDDKIVSILDGTSLRVSFQSIARRLATAGKSDDEIAQAQVDFRPGNRGVGETTPASRAARQAKEAVVALGDGSDVLQQLLADVASGKISREDLAAMVS